MSYNPTFERMISVPSIDAKTTGNNLLWTNTGTSNFIVTGVSVVCTAASSITIPATVGIGTAAGTSDILSAVALTGLTSNTKTYRYSLSGSSNVIASAGTIYANVTVGATGTSQTITINVMGYWT